jgi:IS605 OrfB family transposase
MVVRLVAKVGDAYRLDKRTKRTFRKHGAIAYDQRILRWYTALERVSIWSVEGRLNIAYQCGDRQRGLLQSQQGESDLLYYKGEFYLLATCDIPNSEERDVETALGIDLGVVNIATTSDGETHTSERIERNRQRMAKLRADLQKCGTKSARRHLKQLAGRQARFQKDVNHTISKRIVLNAERTNRGIALEDLTHINSRTRVRGKEQRAKRSNWSFAQLRSFLIYKAALRGVKVWVVDPRYPSQRCYVCGHIERANRKTQDQFLCVNCGHANHADRNAAKNIVWLAEQVRAAVIQPIVSDTRRSKTDNIA